MRPRQEESIRYMNYCLDRCSNNLGKVDTEPRRWKREKKPKGWNGGENPWLWKRHKRPNFAYFMLFLLRYTFLIPVDSPGARIPTINILSIRQKYLNA